MGHEFRNSRSSHAVITAALILFWLAFPLLIYILVVTLVAILSGEANYDRAIPTIVVSILGLSIVMTVPLQVVNQYNRLRVTNDGLYVEVYIFRYTWKFVSWKNVLDVKLVSRLDRWGKPLWLVTVKDLTYWHRLISYQHQAGSNPGILISSDLIERERLLKILEEKLGRRN